MIKFALATVAALAVPQLASAQTANPGQPGNPSSAQSLRDQVQSDLKGAGFSDVKIMPRAFNVQAKDRNGNPVMMVITPDRFAEVTEVGAGGGTATNRTVADNAGAQASAPGNGTAFVSIPEGDDLSSKVIGLDVYNTSNQDIGSVKDIAYDNNRHIQAYVLSVGGFLGLGEHYVAVAPSSVAVSYNPSDQKWHASMNATADQLKSAPEFKYTGRWNGSRS